MTVTMSLIVMMIAMVIGVPIAFSFGLAIVLTAFFLGYDPSFLSPTLYVKLNGIVLLAVPLFVISGGIIEHGKLGDALVDFIEQFVGRLKGALAVIATVASAIFGSISGSGMATLSCIGSIMAPKMRDAKYPMHIVAAILASAAPLGLLIPPSSTMILFAFSGQLSVLACFLSAVIPGIILTILISIVGMFMLRKDPNIVLPPRIEKGKRLSTVRKSTVSAIPALLLPVIVLGSIYGGYMTTTESAGVASIYAIPIAIWVYKGFKARELKNVFYETAGSIGSIMMMLAFIMVLSRILVMEDVPEMIMKLLFSISTNPTVIIIMINIFLVIIGMVMDGASATLLCAPLLLPVITKIGMSPYHFAAILCVNLGMGNVTPPAAPFLYFSAQICDVDAGKIMKPTLILILFAYLPTLLLTTFIPDLALWLTRLIMGPGF